MGLASEGGATATCVVGRSRRGGVRTCHPCVKKKKNKKPSGRYAPRGVVIKKPPGEPTAERRASGGATTARLEAREPGHPRPQRARPDATPRGGE